MSAVEGPLRLAHRGDWRVAPENTLDALRAGMRIPGCDGAEFDVRVAADGVPVLLHDTTLDRVQGRSGAVGEFAAAELAELRVPTLAAALDALPPPAFLDVELKGTDHGRATAAALRAARGERGERAVISSFEPTTLGAMGALLPGWERWLNADDCSEATIALALGLRCDGVAVLWSALTPARIRQARGAGLAVAAWTVRRPVTVERLGRLGVVACCVEGAALGRPRP